MNYIIEPVSLSKEKIVSNLNPASAARLGEISCFDEIDSTNRWLLEQAKGRNVHHHICLTRSQTSGIGRGGKRWCSGESDNILMSVAHQFDLPLSKWSGLSLVVGIAIVNALERMGVKQLSLKWPNDVYLNGKKLAGVLIQSQQAVNGQHCAIVGIGLNIRLSDEDRESINQGVAELSQIGFNVEQREMIIAVIIDELFIAFERFSQDGLVSFHKRWRSLDYLQDRQVRLTQGDKIIEGLYKGINDEGAIRLALQNQQVSEYYVGDISIRALN